MRTPKTRQYYRLLGHRNFRVQIRNLIIHRAPTYVKPESGFYNLRYLSARSKLILALVMRG